VLVRAHKNKQKLAGVSFNILHLCQSFSVVELFIYLYGVFFVVNVEVEIVAIPRILLWCNECGSLGF